MLSSVLPWRQAAGGIAGVAALVVTCGACGSPAHDAGFGDPTMTTGGDDAAAPDPSDDGGPRQTFVTPDASTSTFLGDAGCATATVQAKRQPVYLLFVQDGSDSMNQQNKWTALVPALASIFAKMQSAADPGVAVGLILFPGAGAPYPGSADVPLAFVSPAQASALNARLAAGLSLGTPTHAALMGGYSELESFQPKAPLDPGGKKIVVLITDGVPTDDCANLLGVGGYTNNPCVELAAMKLKEAGPQGPIETFVIGVGDFPSSDTTQFDPGFVGNVAQAGGTGASTCNPDEASSTGDLCYFEIDPSKAQSASQLQMEFETALDAIRGQVTSCSFPIASNGLGQADPTKVNVEIGTQTILQDPKNGWTYDNPMHPTEITLHGTACATASNSLTAKVSIVLGCATMGPK
jgi:von Willebrand factor type A domain